MNIKFWGVRGSFPKPGQSTLRYGGNTTCIEVASRKEDIYILDAGTGIVELGQDLMKRMHGKVKAKLLITHDHWDHIQGFPFFAPAWVPSCTVDVYSGNKSMHKTLGAQNQQSDTSLLTLESLARGDTSILSKEDGRSNHTKSVFEGQQDVERGYFPVPVRFMGSHLTFHDLKEYQIVENGLEASYMYHTAHPGGMFSYKLRESGKTFLFAGDYEHDGKDYLQFGENDERMIAWAERADVFVIDAQYTPEEYSSRRGWGHSQIERVCEIAAAANVRHLVITHHDPMHNDITLSQMEEQAQHYMKHRVRGDIPVTFAHEGLSLEV